MIRNVHREAAQELLSQADWYERVGPGKGEELIERASMLLRLGDFPELGAIWRYEPTVRRFPLGSSAISIIYRFSGDTMWLAFAHEKQEPGYWVSRLSAN